MPAAPAPAASPAAPPEPAAAPAPPPAAAPAPPPAAAASPPAPPAAALVPAAPLPAAAAPLVPELAPAAPVPLTGAVLVLPAAAPAPPPAVVAVVPAAAPVPAVIGACCAPCSEQAAMIITTRRLESRTRMRSSAHCAFAAGQLTLRVRALSSEVHGQLSSFAQNERTLGIESANNDVPLSCQVKRLLRVACSTRDERFARLEVAARARGLLRQLRHVTLWIRSRPIANRPARPPHIFQLNLRTSTLPIEYPAPNEQITPSSPELTCSRCL